MLLKEIRLNDFGKFHNKSITFQDGINLIYGENEAGKSTVHSFIKGMLFGIEKLRGRVSKEDLYERFRPWDYAGSYNGSLDMEVGGKQVRILRNFDKNNKSCTIIDLETGRELMLKPEDLTSLYGGLTEAGYRNTISIEQLKAKTDQELADEVRNYITNLSLSKSNEVDVTKALSYLADKRKELEEKQLSAKLSALEKEIEEGLKQEAQIDNLTLRLKEEEEREKVLRRKTDRATDLKFPEDFPSLPAYRAYLEQFPVVKEKYNNLKEAIQQRDLLREKQASIQEQLKEYREEVTATLKLKINELDTLKYKAAALEEERAEFLKEEEKELNRYKKSRVTVSLLAIITGIAGVLIFMGRNSLLTGVSSAVLLSGLAIYLFFSRNIHRKQHDIQDKSGEYERAISLSKEKAHTILKQFRAEDEKSLKNRYEEALRQEMAYEHMQKQIKDYMDQAELHNRKAAALEQEILRFINRLDFKSKRESLGEDTLEDGRMEELEGFITQQKQFIAENLETLARELENMRIQMEKIKWELVTLEGNEEKLLKNQELYDELLRKKRENDLELKAIKLSVETINKLSVDIHDSFGRELNGLVSDLADELTNHKYPDIKIDEKLNIKAGVKDNYVLLHKLSAGTMEQLYFALRTAIADLVYGPGIMPILLDDSFALYDDKRIKAALLFLLKQRQGQVLLFTCHKREKAILDELNLSYNYIDLSAGN